jgi:hypothetical protein
MKRMQWCFYMMWGMWAQEFTIWVGWEKPANPLLSAVTCGLTLATVWVIYRVSDYLTGPSGTTVG